MTTATLVDLLQGTAVIALAISLMLQQRQITALRRRVQALEGLAGMALVVYGRHRHSCDED